MSKIIIEYNPELSLEAKNIIEENVSYSMISSDESSCQYDICIAIESLEYYDDVYIDDLKILYELESVQNVNFIEF